jgi:GntR family transcriptional regulator, rspAB operon transcriptional repressor
MTDRLKDFVIEDPVLIRDQIYNKVKEAILSGDIPIGSKLLEGRLAERLNVSRTPVREALHLLEMEGFLDSFPKVGYRVREIAWEEALEIYEIRAALEPLAARRAMENGNPEYIDALEQAVAAAEAVLEEEQTGSFYKYDSTFDEIIIKTSGMKVLPDVWATLRQRLRIYRMGAQGSVDTRRKAVMGHRRIIECLKAGDPYTLEAAVKEHLEDFRRDTKNATFKWAPGKDGW